MDAFMATILPTGFDFAPYGWQLCWGQELPLNQYQAIFALISNTYGGNATSTFKLPDMRGRVPIGYGTHGSFNYKIGAQGGRDSHNISMSEMPAHTHGATFTAVTGDVHAKIAAVTGNQTVSAKVEISTGGASTSAAAEGVFLATTNSSGTRIYSSNKTGEAALGGVSASLDGTPAIPEKDITLSNMVTGGNVTIAATGGNDAIDIRPSSQAINFIFCISGIFPSRQ